MRQYSEAPCDGWFYKKDGRTFGPIPTLLLEQLLTSGQLLPRQAVWMNVQQWLVYVTAATAAATLAHQRRSA